MLFYGYIIMKFYLNLYKNKVNKKNKNKLRNQKTYF